MYRRKVNRFDTNPFLSVKHIEFNVYANTLLIKLNSSARKVLSVILKKFCEEGLDKRDRIVFNYEELSAEQKSNISRSTFYRGLKNCIDNEVIAESKICGLFYINPNCFPTTDFSDRQSGKITPK